MPYDFGKSHFTCEVLWHCKLGLENIQSMTFLPLTKWVSSKRLNSLLSVTAVTNL